MTEISDQKVIRDKFMRVALFLKERRQTGGVPITDDQLDESIDVMTLVREFFALLGEGTIVHGLTTELSSFEKIREYRHLDKHR